VAALTRSPAKAGIIRKSIQSVNWTLKALQGRPGYPPGFSTGDGKSCKWAFKNEPSNL